MKLVEKRQSLINEYDALKAKLVAETRSAFNNDEMTRVNAIKLEISEIDNQLKAEKEIEAQRSAKIEDIAVRGGAQPVADKAKDLVNEFRSFLASPEKGEKFTIPFGEISKRATVTTSTNTQLGYTDSHSPLSIAQPQLVLDAIGVKTFYFESGSQDMPSMSSIVGSFGTEDSTVNDQTLTTAKITLVPTFVSASLEVSKKFIATSKPENIASIIAELSLAINKAVEKRTIDSMNSLTAAVNTGATITAHSGTTVMEGALVGQPSAYIFSRTGIQALKNRRIDSGSGRLVYEPSNSASSAGGINGYPAFRSSLQSQAAYGYLVDASALAKAFWGQGIEVSVIEDSGLARKGNVLLIASAMADGSYLDANKVAVAKNVTSWT